MVDVTGEVIGQMGVGAENNADQAADLAGAVRVTRSVLEKAEAAEETETEAEMEMELETEMETATSTCTSTSTSTSAQTYA